MRQQLTKQEKELCWTFRDRCINRPEVMKYANDIIFDTFCYNLL